MSDGFSSFAISQDGHSIYRNRKNKTLVNHKVDLKITLANAVCQPVRRSVKKKRTVKGEKKLQQEKEDPKHVKLIIAAIPKA